MLMETRPRCATRMALLAIAVAMLCFTSSGGHAEPVKGKAAKPAAKENRWEPKIRAFEERDKKSPPAPDGILFLGSSSIVLWDVEESFPDLPVFNRGFGGSQIADSVHYAERIVIPYRPRIIVFYAGDNDVASGKTPQRVAADFQALVDKVHAALPKTRVVFVAIKPSLSRWKLIDKVRASNQLIEKITEQDPLLSFVDVDRPMLGPDGKPRPELFRKDGLHLSDEGYQLWVRLVRPHLKPE